MASKESVQRQLQKVRPPRVQLTYDVEIGDAVEQKEIPFIVGVIADFSARPAAERPRLRERNFVAVDTGSFDAVMQGVAPRASFQVDNRLGTPGTGFRVDLAFRRMEDFRPESVVRQVEPLRMLLEARTRLAELRNKMAGNDRLAELLGEALGDAERLARIGHEAAGEAK